MQEVSGSIPLTSTRIKANTVHRFGVFCGWLGFILTVVGLIGTGVTLPSGKEDVIGIWINLVPVGFVFLLVGVTATQMSKK